MHLQVYPLLLSVHFPPCKHGLGWQYDFAEERIYYCKSVKHTMELTNIFTHVEIMRSEKTYTGNIDMYTQGYI